MTICSKPSHSATVVILNIFNNLINYSPGFLIWSNYISLQFYSSYFEIMAFYLILFNLPSYISSLQLITTINFVNWYSSISINLFSSLLSTCAYSKFDSYCLKKGVNMCSYPVSLTNFYRKLLNIKWIITRMLQMAAANIIQAQNCIIFIWRVMMYFISYIKTLTIKTCRFCFCIFYSINVVSYHFLSLFTRVKGSIVHVQFKMFMYLYLSIASSMKIWDFFLPEHIKINNIYTATFARFNVNTKIRIC